MAIRYDSYHETLVLCQKQTRQTGSYESRSLPSHYCILTICDIYKKLLNMYAQICKKKVQGSLTDHFEESNKDTKRVNFEKVPSDFF